MTSSLHEALEALRAVAEPTRLRLLALLRHGELTVGEITEVLDQSQPRVSRHLKLLCDVGLLDRFREEHWVYYRVPTAGEGAEFAAQILALVHPSDAVLRLDRERMAQIAAKRAKPDAHTFSAEMLPTENEHQSADDLAQAVLTALDGESIGDLLDIGTGSGELLKALASKANHAVGIDT